MNKFDQNKKTLDIKEENYELKYVKKSYNYD